MENKKRPVQTQVFLMLLNAWINPQRRISLETYSVSFYRRYYFSLTRKAQ